MLDQTDYKSEEGIIHARRNVSHEDEEQLEVRRRIWEGLHCSLYFFYFFCRQCYQIQDKCSAIDLLQRRKEIFTKKTASRIETAPDYLPAIVALRGIYYRRIHSY
jgi:hypothetical protein